MLSSWWDFAAAMCRLAAAMCSFAAAMCTFAAAMWWFFGDYRVSPNFFVVLGLRLWLRLGLGCDNIPYFYIICGWNFVNPR